MLQFTMRLIKGKQTKRGNKVESSKYTKERRPKIQNEN